MKNLTRLSLFLIPIITISCGTSQETESTSDVDSYLTTNLADLPAELTLEAYKNSEKYIELGPGNSYPDTVNSAGKITKRAFNTSVLEWPGATKRRLGLSSQSQKYSKANHRFGKAVSHLSAHNGKYLRWISEVAPLYGVDPAVVVGAILGEHTFNVALYVRGAQDFAGNILNWAGGNRNDSLAAHRKMMSPTIVNACGKSTGGDPYLGKFSTRFEYFDCVFNTYKRNHGGSFKFRYFDPRTGGTYGLGQLGPLVSLRVSDFVSQVTRKQAIKAARAKNPDFDSLDSAARKKAIDDTKLHRDLINLTNSKQVKRLYKATIDPKSSIHYISAYIARIQETYKEVAGFDISKNMGVVATLYNVGEVVSKAADRRKRNLKKIAEGKVDFPRENYYGHLINIKEPNIRQLLDQGFVICPSCGDGRDKFFHWRVLDY